MTEIDVQMTIGIFIGFFIGILVSHIFFLSRKSLEDSTDLSGSLEKINNRLKVIEGKTSDVLELIKRPARKNSGYIQIEENEPTKSTEDSTTDLQSAEVRRIFDEIMLDQSIISPESEKETMVKYSPKIVGETLRKASKLVKKDGYSIHPIYINNNDKFELDSYDPKVLGVRLKDPGYYSDLGSGIPSSKAIISEIVDVGGIDSNNRGTIRL